MAKVLVSLTVLLAVAAMLHTRFFDARRSFQMSHLSDVNDQIRGLHGKVFSVVRFRFRRCFDLFIECRFQRIMPWHSSMLST
jgi:hypothetical protein